MWSLRSWSLFARYEVSITLTWNAMGTERIQKTLKCLQRRHAPMTSSTRDSGNCWRAFGNNNRWQIFSELQRRSIEAAPVWSMPMRFHNFNGNLRQMKNHRQTNISVEIIERRKLIPGIGIATTLSSYLQVSCPAVVIIETSIARKGSEKRKWKTKKLNFIRSGRRRRCKGGKKKKRLVFGRKREKKREK